MSQPSHKSSTKTDNSKPNRCIHLVSGDKGGTGKSAFAALMIDYYASQGVAIQAIDGDITNPTLSSCYADAIGVVVSDDRDMRSQLNLIFLAAQEQGKTVIVDLPARSEGVLADWLDAFDVLALAKQDQIELVKWWVSDSDPSTLAMFTTSVQAFEQMPHVLVKNMGLAKPIHWSGLEQNVEIQGWMKSAKIDVLEFPWMDKNLIAQVRQAGTTFTKMLDDQQSTDVLTRGRIQGYLRQGFKALEQTSIFQSASGKSSRSKASASAA